MIHAVQLPSCMTKKFPSYTVDKGIGFCTILEYTQMLEASLLAAEKLVR